MKLFAGTVSAVSVTGCSKIKSSSKFTILNKKSTIVKTNINLIL